MKPIYDDGEGEFEEVQPEWLDPVDMSAPPVEPPLVQAIDGVPVELRTDYRPPPQAKLPDDRLAKARALDRRRQDQEDVRAYLLAAGRREAPQLRSLGSPEAAAVQAQMRAEPKPEDPMSRELMALTVMQKRKELEAKPKALSERDAAYIRYMDALTKKAGEPKPEKLKVTGAPESDDLTPEEEGLLETKLGLPKGSLANVRRKTVGLLPKKTGSGKPKTPDDGLLKLTPTVANEFSDFDVADAQLDQVERDFKNYDVGGKFYDRAAAAMTDWAGWNNDYSAYADSANRAVKVVGKIIEGGKLAEGDMAQYRALIPRSGDSLERMKNKIAGLREFLADIKSGRIKFYRMPKGEQTPDIPEKAPPGYRLLPNGDLEEID
jgi:hypothetical protein